MTGCPISCRITRPHNHGDQGDLTLSKEKTLTPQLAMKLTPRGGIIVKIEMVEGGVSGAQAPPASSP